MAIEKLHGWSVVVNVFHGVTHPVALSVRTAVDEICPTLNRMVSEMGDTSSLGIDLVCRVMCELQQDYFRHPGTVVENVAAPNAVAVPTFARVRDAALTFRAESLCALPRAWYSLVSAPSSDRHGQSQPARPIRDDAKVTPADNPNADTSHVQRFADSDFKTISAMIQAADPTPVLPEHNGKDVCLTWALKGRCTTGCKREDSHVRYSRSVNKEISDLLTHCEVANPQA